METFHIEHAIAQWRRELRKHPGLEPGYIDELESHLRDCIEDLQESGASDEDAFLSAKARTLTTVEEIADEYFKARTRRSITPPWKRKQDWLDFIPPNIMLAYLKQAFRSMKAARVYTWINLLGLTLGIAASMTLFKYVLYEWRTDTFHSKYDRIAVAVRKESDSTKPKLFDPGRYVDMGYDSHPFIEAVTYVRFYNEFVVSKGKEFNARVLIGDSSFFDVFDFQVKDQDTKNILQNPYHILISPDLAKKIFKDEDPIGKPLTFVELPFIVKGILEPPSQNSSLKFDAIASYKARGFWSRISFECLAFSSPEHIEPFSEEMKYCLKSTRPDFQNDIVQYIPLKEMYYNQEIDKKLNFNVGPINKYYLETGDQQNENVLLLIAITILIISTFNFTNLNSVILLKRHKELGVRKVMGAGKRELVLGFLLENLLQILLATTFAVILIWLLSPSITHFAKKEIFLDREVDFEILGIMVFLIAILTTIYPAIRFPRISPMRAIKNLNPGRKSLGGRKLLLTFQFTITICLLIVSFFFDKQLDYMLNRPLEFNSKDIVSILFLPYQNPLAMDPGRYLVEPGFVEGTEKGEEIKAKMIRLAEESLVQEEQRKLQGRAFINRLSDEITADPYMEFLSYGNSPLDVDKAAWKRKDSDKEYRKLNQIDTSPNFDELYGLQIVEGRYFDQNIDKARSKKVVINQAAKNYFGIEDLEDAWISLSSRIVNVPTDYQVIGVIKDYTYEHLSFDVRPLIIRYFTDRSPGPFMMKLNAEKKEESLKKLEKMYYDFNPGGTFRYTFLEEELERLYEKDKQITQIYSFFTLIALFISALGLFAISSFDAQMRIKEIGIRKITGASVPQIIHLLTKDFMGYLLIAIILACPLGALAIMKYLENFAHHTSLSIWIFLAASGITLTVALLTMLWHTWQAADRNPVESLRHE